jgi:TPR repeat protein
LSVLRKKSIFAPTLFIKDKNMKKVMTTLLLAILCLAASAQSAEDLYKEGDALYEAKKYEQAIPKLNAAANKGYKKAQYKLGKCYKEGHGVEKDRKKATQLFMKAAQQGYAKAEYEVAKAYLKGKGTAADEKKARLWLKRALAHENKGPEILAKIRKKAAEGDDDAKRMLKLVGK